MFLISFCNNSTKLVFVQFTLMFTLLGSCWCLTSESDLLFTFRFGQILEELLFTMSSWWTVVLMSCLCLLLEGLMNWLVLVPRLLSDPLELDASVSPDLDGGRFGRRHRLLDRLHQVLRVAHQHLSRLLVLFGSWKKIQVQQKNEFAFWLKNTSSFIVNAQSLLNSLRGYMGLWENRGGLLFLCFIAFLWTILSKYFDRVHEVPPSLLPCVAICSTNTFGANNRCKENY